ncbi:undecaprenyl-diphosphate phosphatase [Pelagibacteraceae bacterium]|nr:undecaprenyl-diphosphate phosphatase [Pelagibacteraceae bacterium]
MIEIIILSIIQGITEFLPVSSSSHLIIFSNYLNFSNQGLSLDVSLHIGSFFAVIVYFRKDVSNFFEERDLFYKILISSLPVMIAGYILVKFDLIEYIRNIKIIGWTTIIFGILLYLSDKFKNNKKIKKDFNYKSVFFIGFLQILSLVPGVSRSGITITAGRFLEFERVEAAKISFLLSIPTLAAVSIYGICNLFASGDLQFSLVNIFSIIFSFLFSFMTIKYFLKYIKNFNLNIFVIYRIVLGITILYLAYL